MISASEIPVANAEVSGVPCDIAAKARIIPRTVPINPINVATDASGFGMHRDNIDVFYWQAQGISRWEIEDGPTWELHPGDLVFIKTGVGHRSTALTPRAGISMSI